MEKQKRETLKSKRENVMYIRSIILHGNNKLVDFDNPETGEKFRYAQFNTRAIKDCPFRSDGCEAVCYATKGNHCFPSVQESRERSYIESKREDFAEGMIYTIRTEKESKRYKDAIMLIRIHESGDFYSVQYLRKWVKVWHAFHSGDGVQFTVYTKSFEFFLMLSNEEKAIINRGLADGTLSINWSIDDTTTKEQKIRYLKCVKTYPKANTYQCTENVDDVEHDNVCDCENCAKCGTCNKGTGKKTVVKIHSASDADMDVYRAHKAEG